MDPRHDPNLTPPPVDGGRRRLAKAGLAAPAVLGILASRPVLGNDAWNCTPSGTVSGNISRPGAVQCNTLGDTPAQWQTKNWKDYRKGVHSTPSQDPKNWPPANPNNGTRFKDVFGMGVDVFKLVPKYDAVACDVGDQLITSSGINSGKCKKGSGNNTTYYWPYNHITGLEIITDTADPRWNGVSLKGSDNNTKTITGLAPTLEEILKSTNNSELFVFAREAIAALLNAIDNPAFPIPPQRVVEMFNATYTGLQNARYGINQNVSWSRDQVKVYFQSLHT